MISKLYLVKLWNHLEARNQFLGPARYDWGDLRSHPLIWWLGKKRAGLFAIKILQGFELIAPILWRRVLGVQRTVVPSLYYHLGLAYLSREIVIKEIEHDVTDKACSDVLALRLDAPHICWMHPYKHHGGQIRDFHHHNDVPASCAHHTARIGCMLLRVGTKHGKADFVEAGVSTANAIIAYHNVRSYNDGTCTISYYPHTDDEVINTGADAAVLFAYVPKHKRSQMMIEYCNGLVRMIVDEQKPDGSWDYCTRRHYDKTGDTPSIDNHHSAMNLGALGNILRTSILSDDIAADARKVLTKGMDFYLENLFLPDGTGLYEPNRRRETGVVGYSEGMSAICTALTYPPLLPEQTHLKALEMLPKLMNKALDFVIPRTGDVACYRFFGRLNNIQSARWGSVPLMQAIMEYLALATQETNFKCLIDQ